MDFSTVSYSALELYSKCGQAFNNRYIIKAEADPVIDENLLLGSLTHYLIEHKLRGSDVNDIFGLYMSEWVRECCQTETDLEALYEYAVSASELYIKCMPYYQGKDRIRNKDGSVPKSPLEYMPTTLSELFIEMGLHEYKYKVDCEASQNNSQLRSLSISNIAATALALASFPIPEWVSSTKHIEYELSYERKGVRWIGYIDWVVENQDGDLVILDHKTSVKKPTGNDVIWHPQLMLYVYLYSKVANCFVEYVGINHLRTGEVVLAQVDLSVLNQIIDHLDILLDTAKSGLFIKHYPLEYNSPCLSYSYKQGVPDKVCPYLSKCWPDFYKDYMEHY